jgi:ketosteroid isomerase-like protein
MSQENVEIVRQVYESVTARLEIPQELFDPDSELDQVDVAPDAVEVERGLEAAQESMREYWEMFEDFHIEIEEVIHADEGQVVTAVRDGGLMRGSDAEVWNRFFHVWTFGDGKIVRLSIHTDKNRALEAAGLRE